jgi:hypothetical protein
MAGESPMTSLCLLKIEILLIPALAGLLACLGVNLRQLYAELAGQIQGRLEWFVEAAHRCPQVGYVAVKSAGETMNVVIVDVHARVIVLVPRRHTMSLATAAGLDESADGHLFSEGLEDVHTGTLPPYEVRRFG